ncbi:hypothetical protein KJ059_16710 [Myxococcota bacterium]|nr:hypothetical protein [Myxococcota bacterium]MCZ7617030.1 hypothetical protein [Myxococcota bacterium]
MLRSARRPGLLLLLLAAVTLGACNPTPSITILTPAHGAFTTASTVTITGRVNNAKPGLDVRVNGQSVPVNPDDTWSVTLPLDPVAIINPVTATLVRLSDGVLLSRQRIVVHAADSVADGDFSASGVGLRLNDSGLDQIEPILESQIDLDLAVLLPVGTVLINNQCMGTFLGLCTGRATVTVVNPPPGISGFAIDVDSQTHQVRGDIDVFDIRADVYISGTGIVPSCGLRISANSTQILGDYTLQPLASDPTSVDVNLVGSPDISFSGFDQEYTSGICDVPLIGDLIQLIIGNVQPLVLDGLVGFLSDPDGAGPSDSPLAEAFEVALGDISIAGPVGEALQVNLEAPLFDVLEDPAGITLGSDVRVTSSVGTEPGQCQPPAGVPDLAASFHVDEPFPTFGSTTPVGGLPFHLGLAISTSAFNQLLKAQIECGLLQIELTELDIGFGPTPLTAGFLAIIIPEFGSLADPGLPLRLVLEPTLAPFLTGENGPSGEIGEIRVGHYLLEVRTLPSPTGSGLFLRGAIDFRAGLTMTFDNLTGQLQVGIGSVAPQDITVGILDNPINTNETSLSMALPFLIAPVLPSLGDNLGAFPIPGFFGLALEGVEVSRSGPFFSLFADLVPAP